MMKKIIKLFDPVIGANEKNVILKTLESKFWASGSGTGLVKKFEENFEKYIKCDVCVAVNSGTSALNLALSLFNVKNKEVIIPSLSFVSTAHCIIENGGKPVFVDVDPETLCIDPSEIENSITKKSAMILPVHFGGVPCDIKKIHSIAKNHNLTVVEDAAHAVGSSYNNKKIGKHSSAVCFSFHPVKNLAMPTGGLISINQKNSKNIKNILLARRWCGITNRRGTDYDVEELGWNYYMNEFSAAIGIEQLKKLDKLNCIRQKIAQKYSSELNIESKIPFDKNCSYHLYWILVKNREKFRKRLSENGIETGTHYKPIHQMSMYKNEGKLPITDSVGKKIVTIPIHPNLKNSEIEKIISIVNKFS